MLLRYGESTKISIQQRVNLNVLSLSHYIYKLSFILKAPLMVIGHALHAFCSHYASNFDTLGFFVILGDTWEVVDFAVSY